jgi:hypothetical protein
VFSEQFDPHTMLALSVLILILASVLSVQALHTGTSAGPVSLITNGVVIAAGFKIQPSVVNPLNKLLTDVNGTILTSEARRKLTMFDYNKITPAAGARGGSILLATVDNFPILEELGLSGAFSYIEPCGLNIPHLHPRANKMLTVLNDVLNTLCRRMPLTQ